jgi:hypothetical protein
VRLHLLPGAPSVDLVIRARREAYAASFEALATDIERTQVQLSRQTTDEGQRTSGDTRPTRDA